MNLGFRSTVTGLIDESSRRVARELRGETALLILASLPLRFLEAQVLTRASALAPTAGTGGAWAYLGTLSLLATMALIPALWARLAFVRAATAVRAGRFRSGHVSLGQSFRVPLASFAAALYLTLVAELVFYWGALTLFLLPVALALSAAVAGASPWFERVGPLAPWRELWRSLPPFRIFVGLVAMFLLAWLIAAINLAAAFSLGAWLALGAFPAFDEAWWSASLSFSNIAFVYLILAGAVLVIEPFWWATWSAALSDRRARDTGDDLRAWFGQLRTEDALEEPSP